MTKATKQAKYSAAMVAAIQAVHDANGYLNAALCADVLKDPAFEGSDITARGVIAKARTMGLSYQKAERLTKTGQVVMTKDEMAEAIAKTFGVSGLKSLAKAEKGDLRQLLDIVTEAFGTVSESEAA